MSFKNLIKKVTLVAGSVALLATAGGAVSANADYTQPLEHSGGNGNVRAVKNWQSKLSTNGKVNSEGYIQYTPKGARQPTAAKATSPLGREILASEHANNSASKEADGNANDYQAGNANNGKLVQTNENNGAEYTAVAGAILAVSAVAFAGYDLSKNN